MITGRRIELEKLRVIILIHFYLYLKQHLFQQY